MWRLKAYTYKASKKELLADMPSKGTSHVPLGSSSYYSSSEEEVTEEPYVEPAWATPATATPAAAFSKAAATAPPPTLAPASADAPAPSAPPPSVRGQLTCQFCWQKSWGGLSGLQQHQRSSNRCRYYQEQATKEATSDQWDRGDRKPGDGRGAPEPVPEPAPKERPAGRERKDTGKTEVIPDSSPSPLRGKERRRKAKDKKRSDKKQTKRPRRHPTPDIRRKRGRRTPSPSPDAGATGKRVRLERQDQNTYVLRLT